jgi:hypothetical protein
VAKELAQAIVATKPGSARMAYVSPAELVSAIQGVGGVYAHPSGHAADVNDAQRDVPGIDFSPRLCALLDLAECGRDLADVTGESGDTLLLPRRWLLDHKLSAKLVTSLLDGCVAAQQRGQPCEIEASLVLLNELCCDRIDGNETTRNSVAAHAEVQQRKSPFSCSAPRPLPTTNHYTTYTPPP